MKDEEAKRQKLKWIPTIYKL